MAVPVLRTIRLWQWLGSLALWLLVLGVFPFTLLPLTLEELKQDSHLTPTRFIRYFSNFKYEYHEEIQPPEVFLFTQSGDCDDFATLAGDVLRQKGYHTRLISVRMPGYTHVVCYVTETHCYLDYNQRAYLKKTVSSPPDLRSIAQKVAHSFDASWTSASEFAYTNRLKFLLHTISQTDPYKTRP